LNIPFWKYLGVQHNILVCIVEGAIHYVIFNQAMTQDFISFSDVDEILITCKSLKKKCFDDQYCWKRLALI